MEYLTEEDKNVFDIVYKMVFTANVADSGFAISRLEKQVDLFGRKL